MTIDAWTLWITGMAIWTAACLIFSMLLASRELPAATRSESPAGEPTSPEPVHRFRL